MTYKTKLQDTEESGPDSVMLSTIIDTLMVWQSEIVFLQNKSFLLQNIVGMSYFSKRCIDADGNDFREEFLLLTTQDFPSFQKKLKTFEEEFQLFHLLGAETLKSSIVNFRTIQQDWRHLQKHYRQLEIQILEGVIRNYPITFI